MKEWRHVRSSVPGTSHLSDDRPCQDAALCDVLKDDEQQEILVAVLSDGAGSASHSEFGSSLACTLFMDEMRSLFQTRRGVGDLDSKFMKDWLARLRSEIALRADELGVPPREFACTLVAAVIASERAVFIQIGDGAIVYSLEENPEELAVPIWPQQGEYENMTNFATEPAGAAKLVCWTVEGACDRIALFSDGLQRLALSFADKKPYQPFFTPFFTTLDKTGAEHVPGLNDALASFLSSPRVNARTDDDKTLIIASRRDSAGTTLVEESSSQTTEDSLRETDATSSSDIPTAAFAAAASPAELSEPATFENVTGMDEDSGALNPPDITPPEAVPSETTLAESLPEDKVATFSQQMAGVIEDSVQRTEVGEQDAKVQRS